MSPLATLAARVSAPAESADHTEDEDAVARGTETRTTSQFEARRVYDGKREIRLLGGVSGLVLLVFGLVGLLTGRYDRTSAVATAALGGFVLAVLLWRGDALTS